MFSFWGSIGVNLFFLLSGASLTHRWQNRWNLKEYVKGRILAIYPDFWVIFFSLFVYGEVLHGNNASVPKWKLIFSIIGVDGYMQQFTSTFYKIGEWFLGCLLILYFLFVISFRLTKGRSLVVLFFFYFGLLGLLCVCHTMVITWYWDKPLCFGLACCFHSFSVVSTIVNNLYSAESYVESLHYYMYPQNT